jgi:hypothetical protein
VLSPFRHERAGTFQRYDWSLRSLGPADPLPRAKVLIVDLIELFRPDALPALDLAVWCDVDLATSAQRGMARDRKLGRRHENLWRDVWLPNEQDFTQRFSPRQISDMLYEPSR